MLGKLQISFFNPGIFLLVLTSVIILISCTIRKDPLPETLYGFKLVNKLTGVEAKKFVDQLHLNEVAPQKNEIGFYESPVGSLMIYVTYYDDNAKSQSEYKKMISKISPENSVFYDPKIVTIDQKNIYKCYGMAQVHYVFPSGKELYWVSIDPGLGDKFITEYLNHIN
jgi:hypothetical protein